MRGISDVDISSSFNVISVCSGSGAGDLALRLAVPDARTVCYVEIEAHAVASLVRSMQAHALAQAPVWTDAKSFDGRPWRGRVDCVVATYPCQPFSCAGKRQGESDPRHIWPSIARIIGECEPAMVFIENVRGHLRLGFENVCRDLQAMGYQTRAGLWSSEAVGAPHGRVRLFALAYNARYGHECRPGLRGIGEYSLPAQRSTEFGHESGTGEPERYSGARRTRRGTEEPAGFAGSGPSGDDSGTSGALAYTNELAFRSGDQNLYGSRQIQGESAGNGCEELAHGIGPQLEERRRERENPDGQCAAAERSGAELADAERDGYEGNRPAGGKTAGLRRRFTERGAELADIAGGRRDIRVRRGTRQTDAELERPYYFPPYRTGDWDRWTDVLVRSPWLRPAISQAEAEHLLRRVAPGMADKLEFGRERIDRLRAVGEGITPLAMAFAFVILAQAHGLELRGADEPVLRGEP